MNLNLRLSAPLEAALKNHAAAAGQDVETFVLKAVEEKLADQNGLQNHPQGSEGDFAAWLEAWINRHPTVSHSVDDSRESIYAGRGE